MGKRYKSEQLDRLDISQRNGTTWFNFGGWQSEAASRKDDDGSIDFVTISPGVAGYEFRREIRAAGSALLIREGDGEYRFHEVP